MLSDIWWICRSFISGKFSPTISLIFSFSKICFFFFFQWIFCWILYSLPRAIIIFVILFTFFFLLLNFGILDHSLGLQRKKKWMFVVFFLDSCFIKYFSWKRWWKLLDYWLICGFSSFWISLMIPLCYQEVIQYSVSYCYIILRCHLKLLLLIFLWGFRSARENFLTI